MPHDALKRSLNNPDLHVSTRQVHGPYGPDGFAVWCLPYDGHWMDASPQGGPARLTGPAFIVRRIDGSRVDWMTFRLDGKPAGKDLFGSAPEGVTLWGILRVAVDDDRIRSAESEPPDDGLPGGST